MQIYSDCGIISQNYAKAWHALRACRKVPLTETLERTKLIMLKNLNPVVKAILMFVLGCALMLLVTWLVSLIKKTEFEIDWLYIIGMGIVIALLDLLIPAEKRKANREKLKNSFKK